MTKRTRVLIADDHPVVRQGMRAVLEAQPHVAVVGEAAGIFALPELLHQAVESFAPWLILAGSA